MKRLLLVFVVLLAVAAVSRAGGTITVTTAAPADTTVRLLLNSASALVPVYIDAGDGVQQPYTIDPKQPAYNRWITLTVKGKTMKFEGDITEFNLKEARLTSVTVDAMAKLEDLDLAHNEIATFKLLSNTPLIDIDLSYNRLSNTPGTNPTLSLEYAGKTLSRLGLAHNDGLTCLDMRDLVNLETLTLNDCPQFASIFICMPEGRHTSLRSINISNCSLSHFYPVSLPALRTLDLANNILMSSNSDDPFQLGSYPALTNLTVSGNKGIKNLDVTGCTKLEQLRVSDCSLTSIDVSQCPLLNTLSAGGNNIATFDIGNNPELTSLLIEGNPVKELDMDKLPKINTLNISYTNISRIDLMKAFYLKKFEARGSKLEFVHFGGQQPNRIEKVDLRDCPGFTYESMAYTIMTLPVSKKVYQPNLLLSGSKAEKSNIAFITGIDYQWICDVTGDNTAEWTECAVTLDGATDTGTNVAGELDRLYPYMGMGMTYDFDRYTTAGGDFLICQWVPESSQYHPSAFQSMQSVTTTARKGVPVHIYPYPAEGKRFKSVTVNGKEIFDRWFVIDGPSTIHVNFAGAEDYIALTTKQGQQMSMLVNTASAGESVWIDWGTGTRTEYARQNKYTSGYTTLSGTRIDGTAAGTTVKIYGNVAGLDVSGFGDVAADFGLWDNAITAVDLSGASQLKLLNLHWNPITAIDLSGASSLEVLSVSYTNLETLDLSGCPSLLWLSAYSDGFDDPSSGIRSLSAIDITKLPSLLYLDVKNNKLTSLDTSRNPQLAQLIVNGNKITSLDLSANGNLRELDAARNKLATLDLSANKLLTSLAVGDNSLHSLNLSANTALEYLSFASNYITDIDLSANTALRTLYINGNGIGAAALNDIYYRLPQRSPDPEGESGGIGALSYNLAIVQGASDREANDATGSDTSIAVDRGWKPSQTGTNSGCETAYLDILAGVHGTAILVGEDGTEYRHGSKVPKYAALTVKATPETGYALKGFRLGEDVDIEGDKMTMPGIYTKFTPVFASAAGIDEAAAAGIAISAGAGSVVITAAEAIATVYTPAGRTAAPAVSVAGSAEVTLPAGMYIVRVSSAAGVVTRSVVVR